MGFAHLLQQFADQLVSALARLLEIVVLLCVKGTQDPRIGNPKNIVGIYWQYRGPGRYIIPLNIPTVFLGFPLACSKLSGAPIMQGCAEGHCGSLGPDA